MSSREIKASLVRSALASSVLLLASGLALADSNVTLTARPTSTTLPDGTTVPMWGLVCGTVSSGGAFTYVSGTNDSGPANLCTTMQGAVPNGAWQPPLIRVPSGQPLHITLHNGLSFSNYNAITSLVIVGQVGGGLGTEQTRMHMPQHQPQGTTWPGVLGGTDVGAGDTVFTPPAQADRVRSFGTEVNTGATVTLDWNDLRPGTYLLETGTQPSIQGPMGLYGVVVVTDAAYPGQTFDADVPLLLSEIDAVQNTSVDQAVNTASFSDTKVWNGQKGQCGDPAVHSCFPPAVNYDPRYYLINGVSFDRSNANSSALNVPAAGPQGRVLLRLVN